MRGRAGEGERVSKLDLESEARRIQERENEEVNEVWTTHDHSL